MLSNAITWRNTEFKDSWIQTGDREVLKDLRSIIPVNPLYAYSKEFFLGVSTKRHAFVFHSIGQNIIVGLPIMIQRIGKGNLGLATKYGDESHVRYSPVMLQIQRMEFATDVIFREATKLH
eukprot:326902-Pyramimonas_sp.AAC.1